MIVNNNLVFLLKASVELEDSSYDQAVSSLNLESVTIPPVTFEWVNLPALANHLSRPDLFSSLVLTSQRSVLAIAESLKDAHDKDAILQPWKDKQVFVVGTATHSATENILGIVAKGKESGNAAALAKLIIENGNLETNKYLLFPCSSLKQETLPAMLCENDIAVKCVECYKTTPHPRFPLLFEDLLKAKGVPGFLVFFSPSGVKSALPVMKEYKIPFNSIKIVSVGPTTKQYLESLGLCCAAMAPTPDAQGLKSALLHLGLTEGTYYSNS